MRTIIILTLILTIFGCGTDNKVKKKDNDKKIEDLNKNDDKNDNKNSIENKNNTDVNETNNSQNDSENNNTKKDEPKIPKIEELEISSENISLIFDNLDKLDFSKNLDKRDQLITLLFHIGELGQLKTIIQKYPVTESSPKKIREIETLLNKSLIVDSKKIGVILPKNSKYKRLAEDVEYGIRLAKHVLNLDIEFIIKETDATEEATEKATEELIFEENVSMIIGTIRKINTQKVALITERFNIPFIAISNDDESSNFGKYVFNYFTSLENSTEFLAKYSIEKLGLKKFAIFYPNSSYGEKNMVAFWHAVEKLGGKVTAVQHYSHNKDEYIEPAKKLVGRYNLNLRSDYTNKRKEIMDKYEGYQRQKQLESLEKDVEPIIDFEAIYIPDSAKKIALVLPYLALYDVNFKTPSKWQQFLARQKAKDKNFDLKFVQLLGSETWTSQIIADASGKYVQGAIFPTVYHPYIKNDLIVQFTSKFAQTYKRPATVFALYGYEIAEIVSQIFGSLESPDGVRDKIVKKLLITNFNTISGVVKFKSDGTIYRDSLIMMEFTEKDFQQLTETKKDVVQ